jgi:hypothetical protein
MKDLSILKPVFVQVTLTFVLLFWMAKERLGAFRSGGVTVPGAGQRPVWSGRAGTISNAFHNQLELPMLFYAVVVFALIADAVDWEMIWLAWAYAGFRVIQAIIHTTYNQIPHRFVAFLLSNIALIAMWVNLGLSVFLGW